MKSKKSFFDRKKANSNTNDGGGKGDNENHAKAVEADQRSYQKALL